MSKQVSQKQEAQEKIRKGINITANAIKSTIGPRGRNAFIDNPMQPTITNDGVTIAQAITLEDKLENLGAWLVKSTSAQTNDDAGDGTSTTSVLLQAIIDEAMKLPVNPMVLSRELKEASKEVVQLIKEASRPVALEKVKDVATISAESEEIGQIISDIFNKVGEDASITVEQSQTPELSYSVKDGLETKVGYMHPQFITDARSGTAEHENAYVFACERRISTLPELQTLFVALQKAGISTLVMLVADIDNAVLGQLVANKMMGNFTSLVIKVRGAELEDMAAASGATLVSDVSGITFSDIKIEHLGQVRRIVSTDKKTLIVNPAPTKYIEFLEIAKKNTNNEYEIKNIEIRTAKLRGGVAVIKVGAHSDTERDYLKYKVEDAINATTAALEEGLVEGGGMCLYRISEQVSNQILAKALKSPLKAIIENAGEDFASVTRKLQRNKGYDANTGHNVDMFEKGIVDPAKVTRCAFENALSAASTFITAEVAITDLPEPKKV